MLYAILGILLCIVSFNLVVWWSHRGSLKSLQTAVNSFTKIEYNPQICSGCDRVVVKHVPDENGGVICSVCVFHNRKNTNDQ